MSENTNDGNTRLQQKLHELLQPSEEIVWTGHPGSMFSPRKYNVDALALLAIFIPSLIFGCFICSSFHAVPQTIFLVPLLAIGLPMVFMVITDYSMRKNTVYAMTNQRAIFLSIWPKQWLLEVGFDHHPTITKVVHQNGQGTLSFAGEHDSFVFKLLGAEAFALNPRLLKEPVFFDIENAEHAYLEAQFLSLSAKNVVSKSESKLASLGQIVGSIVVISFLPCLFIGQVLAVIGILGMQHDGF